MSKQPYIKWLYGENPHGVETPEQRNKTVHKYEKTRNHMMTPGGVIYTQSKFNRNSRQPSRDVPQMLDALQIFKEQKKHIHIQNHKEIRYKSTPGVKSLSMNMMKKDINVDVFQQERLAQYNLMIEMVDKANNNVNQAFNKTQIKFK